MRLAIAALALFLPVSSSAGVTDPQPFANGGTTFAVASAKTRYNRSFTLRPTVVPRTDQATFNLYAPPAIPDVDNSAAKIQSATELTRRLSAITQDGLSPITSTSKYSARKGSRETLQYSTVFGQGAIISLNLRAPDDPEYNVTSGICKIIIGDRAGTVFFVGNYLHMLVTNRHVFSKDGPAQELTQEVHLQCGSHGRPAVFGFDETVTVTIEKQGTFEDPEEDVVLLSVKNAAEVFRNYKHYSFSVTQPARKIDEVKALVPSLGKIQLLSFPAKQETIPRSNGIPQELYPEEVFTSDSCGIFKQYGGIWTHTCAEVPGSSGGVAIVNLGKQEPILFGMNKSGELGKTVEENENGGSLYLPQADGSKVNKLISLESIQKVISNKKDNNPLWMKLLAAESAPDSTSGISQTGWNEGSMYRTQGTSTSLRPNWPSGKLEPVQAIHTGF